MTSAPWTLHCTACAYTAPGDRLASLCPDCGQPLSVRLAPVPRSSVTSAPDMWRYAAAMPILDGETRVSLGEGLTPLAELPMFATISISLKSRPDCSAMCSQEVASTSAKYSSIPIVCCLMNSRSNTALPPFCKASRSHCNKNFAMPRNTAMSPPKAGRRYAVFVGSEPLLNISIGICGFWKRSNPRSFSGFRQITCAPRFTASRRGSKIGRASCRERV